MRDGEQTGIAIGNIDGAFEGSAEENADDALAGVKCDAIIVVDDAEEHQRMHNHLLDRPSGDLLRFYHIHCLPRNPSPRSIQEDALEALVHAKLSF